MTSALGTDADRFEGYTQLVYDLLAQILARWEHYKDYVQPMLSDAQHEQNTDGYIPSIRQAVNNAFGVDVQHEIHKARDLIPVIDDKINAIRKDLLEEMTRAKGVLGLFTMVDFLRQEISPGLRALTADMPPSSNIHDWTGAGRDAFNTLAQTQIDTVNATADRMMRFGDWLNELARANGIYLEHVDDMLNGFKSYMPWRPDRRSFPPDGEEVSLAVTVLQSLSDDLHGLDTDIGTERAEFNKRLHSADQFAHGTWWDPAGGVLPSIPSDKSSEDAWREAAPTRR